MSAFADRKETPIATSQDNEEMNVDEDNISDISDQPEPYQSRGTYRGEIDHTPHTTGTARINEVCHIIKQAAALGIDHTSDGINHAKIKIDKFQKTVNSLVNIIEAQAATIGRLDNTGTNLAGQMTTLVNTRNTANSNHPNNHNNNNNNNSNNNPNRRQNNRPPPPINNKSRPATKAPSGGPTSYAGTAAKGAETAFQKVTNSKAKKPPPLFSNTVSPIQRESIITTTEVIPQGIMDDRILKAVNESLAGQFGFMFPKSTSRNTIVL